MRRTGNATVLLWLRDAHAMESQSVQMLTSQLPSLVGFPEFHESVKAHAELSHEQRERLGSRIAGLGQATSLLRDGLGMTGSRAVEAANNLSAHFNSALDQARSGFAGQNRA